MSSSAPAPATVLEVFDALDSPGTPLTTPEVAEEFDCVNRTIYNKLDALVDEGSLETKKVGARGRVWWRPPGVRADGEGHDSGVALEENADRTRQDRLLEEQKRLVEVIASGAPLEECLSSLCTTVSTLDPTTRASIVLTDDEHKSFERCIAPDLSPAWREELERLPIDDSQIGTCGEAVFHGDPVTCEDVKTDDRWSEDWRELCLANDVLAGHSVPIHDEDGEALGSFMLCFDEPRTPTEWELLAEFGTHVASIALERERSNRELRESEERLRLATDAAEQGVWELDLQTNDFTHHSPRHDEIFGYEEPGDWSLETFLDHVHPDDREQVEQSFEDAFETGDWTVDCRIIRADDEQRWITAQGEVHDDSGEPVRAIGTVQDITKRKQTEEALREKKEQLASDLAATRQLQDTSTSLIQEDDIDTLDEEVLDAAVTIMDADFASMQRFDADRGELELLTHQGFSPEAEEAWGWVDPDEGTSCARALETGDRVVVPDVETSAFMAGTSDLEMFRQTGIQAVQTTPLVSRSGELLGMISTHWNEPHDPSERDLRSLDVLARQAADLIEQKQAEEELHEREEQLSSLKDRLLETSPTGILLVDDAGEISFANDRVADILGRSVEELTGLAHNAPEFDFVDPDGEPIPEAELPYEQIKRTSDVVFSIEVGATQPDGQRVWLSVNATPLYDGLSDEATEVMVALEDITDRKQATEALDHLNDASRELMNADEQEIVDEAASLMQTVLGGEYSGLWRYDSDTGELHQSDESTDPPDRDDIRYPDGFDERAWQTFVSEDRDVDNDLSPHPEIAPSETPIRSEVIVPLGRHGVLCAGSTRPNEFEETTVDLAETVATNVETALDRADREGQLARQNEALTRLDRLNSIIREIDQILVQADTREEIDHVVCERLADSNLYEFAWIGEHDAAADTIDPQEWAGVDSGYVDELTITTDDTPTGQGPVGTAVRTRETQVVEDIATDARFGPWREQTLAQGVRSCISIPLVYEDALYGVLTVYAGPLNTDEKDRGVLNEFGETIAHAINAIETKETLHTDSVVELTLGIQPSNSILGRLAQQAGCRFEFEGLVPQADDSSHVFFTAHDATSDEILAAGSEAVAVKELTRITDREDSSLFKARLSGPTLASLLVEQDAVVRTLTFKPDGATAVVDLPSTATVREFIEAIQTTHSDTDLLTRRTRERAIQTPHEFKTAVKERLTARQQETLRTAYLSGFFQSPRESTGQEIAGLLEISQTTFTQHLRAGQHDLFELLFDQA
ncbi:GAF domain-containing protein [Natrinema sp. 74]|uniref:GAF domain-containing protein n=1 Tax=Natrinema sp. 74 TaxID=3384159 RepID=UPI0038D494BA